MRFSVLVVLLFGLLADTVFTQQLEYPKTRRVNHADTYHGMKVADPYRWMENAGSDELQGWIKSQDSLLKDFVTTSVDRKSIQARLAELVKLDSYNNPSGIGPTVQKRDSSYFFTKIDAGTSGPVLYVKDDPNSPRNVVFDAGKTYKDGKTKLAGYGASPNGKRQALYLSESNSRWFTMKILDSGKEVPEKLAGLHLLGGTVAWSQDNKGFFYTRFQEQEQAGGLPPLPVSAGIYYHSVGTPQEKDALVYRNPKEQNTLFNLQTSVDGRYLFIETIHGDSPNNKVLYAELRGAAPQVKTLFRKKDSIYRYLGNRGSRIWFYTNLDAPKGRIISVALTDADKRNLREVVAQRNEPISAGSRTGGNALGIFGDQIVLLYMQDSNPVLRIFDLEGRPKNEIRLPSGGTIWGGLAGKQNDPEVFYMFLSLTTNGTFYRLNVETGKNEEFLVPKLKLDPSNYVTTQVFFKSKDGTRVPMFIAHRKGLARDSRNPAYIYGYGSLGWVAFMWYQPHILTWLDMGGIYAVPGIRGGGEYGEDWHKAGVKQNKRNTVDDYIAAAEFLVENRYTSKKKIVANGGSLSSMIAATASLAKRPDLFGVSILDIPVLDMLRYQEFGNGRFWTSEFGSPEKEDEFKSLHAISPYHNVKVKGCYPPTLVMVGEKDQVASPFHAYKFVARLQNSQRCQNPVLMKMMWGAGHNLGSTDEQKIDSWTDQLSFIFNVLNDERKGS